MTSKPTFLFTSNGDYQNRGCEAISRGTIAILQRAFGLEIGIVDAPLAATKDSQPPDDFYKNPELDYIYCPMGLSPSPSSNKHSWFSLSWLLSQAKRIARALHLRRPKAMQRKRLSAIYEMDCAVLDTHFQAFTAALSLGGDTFSLDYGLPYRRMNHGSYIYSRGVPYVIWGASVGPFDDQPEFEPIILDHLRKTTAMIFLRERRSLEYLKIHGIKQVTLTSDPAFVMAPQSVSAERLGFELPSDAIGVNLSPLMQKYFEKSVGGSWSHAAAEIIRAVRDHFGRPVLLIPHVTGPVSNDDYLFMRSCLAEIEDSKGIYLIDGRLNAPETKWVISRLSCMVAARTHATIAAFSTYTPTVSLAYSIKAYGINERLFGHCNYLVAPENLGPSSVIKTIERVQADESSIRSTLEKVIPGIQQEAFQAGETLRELLGLFVVSSG